MNPIHLGSREGHLTHVHPGWKHGWQRCLELLSSPLSSSYMLPCFEKVLVCYSFTVKEKGKDGRKEKKKIRKGKGRGNYWVNLVLEDRPNHSLTPIRVCLLILDPSQSRRLQYFCVKFFPFYVSLIVEHLDWSFSFGICFEIFQLELTTQVGHLLTYALLVDHTTYDIKITLNAE